MPFLVNSDSFISTTPVFPKEEITFYDISPILEDQVIFKAAMSDLSNLALPMKPDIIAGIDALGVLFALPLAMGQDCRAIMVRKAGKSPGEVLEQSFVIEYGKARLSLRASRQLHNRRIVLCDDLLATSGPLAAAKQLVK